MTCIVGIAAAGRVYIGGDAAGSNGESTRSVVSPKVFRLGKMVIGYNTSFRMGQLLQYELTIKPQAKNIGDLAYMITEVAERARELFKEQGFSEISNNAESGGSYLVGYRGALYLVQSDYSVLQHTDGFEAIGCGTPYALGALKALGHLSPKKRIRRALEIAAYYAEGVQGPFTIKAVRS